MPDALTPEQYIRLAALNAANVHCQGRFEPMAVLDVATAFQVYISMGHNMLKTAGGQQ
jgi:hypothetical protein